MDRPVHLGLPVCAGGRMHCASLKDRAAHREFVLGVVVMTTLNPREHRTVQNRGLHSDHLAHVLRHVAGSTDVIGASTS